MFPEPPFAEHWLEQVTDQGGWEKFQVVDLQRLQQKYGITWVVLQQPGLSGLMCPYKNDTLLVCRLCTQLGDSAARGQTPRYLNPVTQGFRYRGVCPRRPALYDMTITI